jgi:drug/metabolite transporter (DMT)-like permease
VVFGEQLSPTQWSGGAMVLSAVLIVQWPSRSAAAPLQAADEYLVSS